MDKVTQQYRETDKLSDLICGNYSHLQVMSRFGLSLGFGDGSVKEVCEKNGVDCNTFLAVLNFIANGILVVGEETNSFSITSLMDYLKQAHSYFLEFNLPTIRRKLIEAIDCSADNEVSILILKYFDEYVKEVRKHMEHEDEIVFKYVTRLQNGEISTNYQINTFAKRHNQIETRLTELKNIIIKYYPSKANNNLLNSVLFDIFSCEQDLASHCKVEDYLFVPAVRKLEKEIIDHEK